MSVNVEKNNDLFHIIHERYSIRSYDPNVTIPKEELLDMLKEAVIAPSSSNLQPWRFLVITDPKEKEILCSIANNQQQVRDASATIVVLGDAEAYKQAEKIYARSVELGMPEEAKNAYVPNMVKTYASFSPEVARGVALVDGGLVSMQFMLIAKAKGYDTVPIGGFSAERLIEEYNIPSNLVPVMLISVGKGNAPGYPRSRLPIEDVTFWNRMK